jgi:hypothetical protein
MINTKLQSIIDTKSAIGNAIVNKGGTITGETPFFNYAAQIDGISTGTPQTIFAASDGSKWALTNVVNLTNVSNNVTYDFNYWQPANNSTSDPILNVGTVGANISGNIRLVPVNQVNIAQYVNLVATDTSGAKYEGFNGYDSVTNPTPTGNTTFNRWLLNNSATGTVLFANATFTTGTYNGPNTVNNSLTFVNNTANYGGTIESVATNNGFIFAGGGGDATNGKIQKFYESNLARENNSAVVGVGYIQALVVNNGFVYVGGYGPSANIYNGVVSKYHQGNLAFVGNTANFAGVVWCLTVNNGFIYAGGDIGFFNNGVIRKYGESNLTLIGTTANFGGIPLTLKTNNGFFYAGGETNQTIQKFGESNLVRVGNTPAYVGTVRAVTTNNGFIYAGGDTFSIQKFNESTLAFVNSVNFAQPNRFGSTINALKTNNGFLYVGGFPSVKRFNESNFEFDGNTPNYSATIKSFTLNNGFIYAGGDSSQTVKKYIDIDSNVVSDTQTFYTATKIKE